MDEAASTLRGSTDDAGSNSIFCGNASEAKFRINLKIPGYTAVLDDGSSKEFEGADHVLEVFPDAYLMSNLVADVATKTKWGTCQEAAFWYWNVEKKGLESVVTDADLKSVFQKFWSTKVVSFVVEFAMKPAYKCNIALDHKLEKLPVRRNPNLSWDSDSSDDESVEEEENVDPALMDDEDIFLDDHEVFVSLGLRAEEVAARMNMGQDGLGLNQDDALNPIEDLADEEPRFAIDRENPKIRKGETFPTMEDFRMALRQFAILNEFEVHKVKTDKKRYRAAFVGKFVGMHRECMRHLWANFKKKYRGDVYDKNMWPAARAYKLDKFQHHYNKVIDANPEVVEYMKTHHNHKWSRSMFSNEIKCDYVNNNLAESFNKWIKKIKDLPPVDLLDKLRQMTMDLWDKRMRIGEKLSGHILPTVIKQLKAQTRGLGHMKVHKGPHTAEVFGTHYDMTPWRHVVELNTKTCSCGEWQMTGKPCLHALAFIQMIPDVDMGRFVHDYYTVERFRAAYSGTIPPMTDKSQWPQVNMGFKLLPPPLKREPGRQRKNRFKASHEPGAKKQKRCLKCGEFGHRENGNCPLNEPKQRKRVPLPKRKPKRPKTIPAETISPGSITRRLVNLVHEGQVQEAGTSSTSCSSARRSLELSQEGGSTSNI